MEFVKNTVNCTCCITELCNCIYIYRFRRQAVGRVWTEVGANLSRYVQNTCA